MPYPPNGMAIAVSITPIAAAFCCADCCIELLTAPHTTVAVPATTAVRAIVPARLGRPALDLRILYFLFLGRRTQRLPYCFGYSVVNLAPDALTYASPNSALSWAACSCDRLVETISNLGQFFISATTRSPTVLSVSRKSADVLSVTLHFTSSMDLSSMP